MPITVAKDLPAIKTMENENIFVMDETRAVEQDIRPLRIAVLNLMPLKEDTEVHMMRILSNTPLQVVITFLTTASYTGKNTPINHLNQFYQTFDDVKNQRFDGMIITGAPVEQIDFTEVAYWDELKEIMEWSDTHVTSTFHICWGAQAGIFYHYGVDKKPIGHKLSGIYEHQVYHRREPLVRGFDDVFFAPHSRYTTISREDVEKNPKLQILADSEDAGVFIVLAEGGKRVFVFGHPEYDRLTLDYEYKRDLAKGLEPEIPVNYYPDDNPDKRPLLRWRSHSNALYTNWLNYYVYQNTPYEW